MFFIFCANIQAQDIHFSQFWEPSSFSNPTHIGNFDGNFKLSAQYRNQWSQFNTPINSVFADATLKINQENHYWAFSMSFLRDQLSYLSYHQIRFTGSASYQQRFTKKILGGLGFQVGTRMTNIDYSKLTFDRQWDPNTGEFIHANPSFENFNNQTIYTPFIGLGASINLQSKKILHTFDIASLYVSQNKSSDFVFYQPFKFTTNYHSYIKLKENITLMPKIGLITTASANSINSGLLVKLNLNEKQDIYGGILYRWGIDRNGDAIIPVVGARIKQLRVGFSYDYVASGLKQEGFKSAYEVSVSYIFKVPKQKFFSIDCLRL